MSTLDAVRPQRARPWWERTGPGLAVAAGGAAAAMAVNRLVPALSALTVAVLIGVVVGGALPAVTADGLQWATRTLLRAGVVLLGLQLSLTEVVRLGPGMLA
ncbi:putative sulfate exporter family transporter, partial [Micromonospora aurantiaca]|nr:putative sulfate exporter family transporter [Micromonospora aurantiaca]